MSAGAALRFAEVSKRFGKTQALRGLSLEVPTGTLFGLIGPNGAGKTTAFSIACGFLRPDAGADHRPRGAGLRSGAAQGPGHRAAPGRRPRAARPAASSTCMYFGRLQGLDPRRARRDAERLLDEVGLGDRKLARAKTLSHGMLRRLAVAQALIGDPELVLLDEPTSGLDPRHAHEIRELLRRARTAGRTVVISSHNLPELETLCEHVAFIDRGLAVAAGATDVVTGKGQEVEVELSDGPVPLEALQAALTADQVSWDPDRRLLRVLFRAAPSAGPKT